MKQFHETENYRNRHSKLKLYKTIKDLKWLIRENGMVSFAIILCAVGMLVIPLGRIYALWQRHRHNVKFSDGNFLRRYRNAIRIISVAICGIAILIIFLIQKNVI